MRIIAGLSMALLFSGALFGQHSGARAGNGGYRRGGGYHLGGGGLVGSGLVGGGYGYGGAFVAPYAYPAYFGSGYYYPPDYSDGSYPPGAYPPGAYPPTQAQQQPNVTVVYPPPSAPPMVNQFGPGAMPPPGANPQPVSPYEPSSAQNDDQATPDHYLIALKDHTIYSVVAYWVEGDTLHYFTAGNVHNQASLSLVDRDLTARLNKESGQEVKLPAAK
jgi:hypothetical protein